MSRPLRNYPKRRHPRSIHIQFPTCTYTYLHYFLQVSNLKMRISNFEKCIYFEMWTRIQSIFNLYTKNSIFSCTHKDEFKYMFVIIIFFSTITCIIFKIREQHSRLSMSLTHWEYCIQKIRLKTFPQKFYIFYQGTKFYHVEEYPALNAGTFGI